MPKTLAVDLGGTWLRAAVVGIDGVVIARKAVRTPLEAKAPDALVALAAEFAPGMARAVVGLPGRVDHLWGRLDTGPNIPPSWLEELRSDRLSQRLGVHVELANDADLAAVGEWAFGAARGLSDVVYVTVSTGVGAGVILNGRIARGRRSIGEIGHTVVDRAAARAGQPATLEALGSGATLGRAARRLGFAHAADLVDAARRRHPAALAALADVLDALSVGLVNAAYLFSPEVLVIGGGLGRVPEVIDAVAARMAESGPPGLGTRVVPATLGDDAGLVGAVAWARATGATGR